MKTREFTWAKAAGLFTAAAITGNVWGATLKIGDPAPKLQTGKWVQGAPVKSFEKDKAYIVEFWATWCGPCRVSIPHLNEVHNKFKDKGLIVIGQDCWEKDESLVEPFIKKMGDKMTYRVALDDKQEIEKGKMAETWMEAAGRGGIPSAFLVDKTGSIAWIGHPMELEEVVIEKVLAGNFDLKKAAAENAEREKNQQRLMELSRELNSNMEQKNWEKAEATLSEMEKLLPEKSRSGLDMARFNIFLGKADYAGAATMALKVSDGNKENAMLQNQLAWELITHEGNKTPDLDVAQKIAGRANDAAKGEDPAIIDTYARVLFMQGKKDKAIELQQKAIGLSEGDLKESLQKTLDSYKEGKLPPAE
jgi:thiol-disulfide isomerase/thioredoxin